MDFQYSGRTVELIDKVRDFMDDQVIPAESVYEAELAAGPTPHALPPVMIELKEKARAEGSVEPLPDPRRPGVRG